MTVRQLLNSIDAAELKEWMAYYAIEPFGPPMDDLRMGIQASLTANANRSSNQKPFKPEDFTPWTNKDRYLSEEQQIENLIMGLGVPVVVEKDDKK